MVSDFSSTSPLSTHRHQHRQTNHCRWIQDVTSRASKLDSSRETMAYERKKSILRQAPDTKKTNRLSIRAHRLSDAVTQMIDPTNSTTPSVRLGEGVQKAESSHQVVQQQRLNSYYLDRDTDPPR